MTEPVALESIIGCFGGVIPAPFATCSPEGVPNVTYMSIVQYVDADRVALSRQFFNKTRANLDANPYGQVRVVDPETLAQYELDLEFLHSESQGPTFEAMRAGLDAVASQTGMAGVFRLRGVDIHRVLRCAEVGPPVEPPRRPRRDPLVPLDELTRRLAACAEYEEATGVALAGLEDLFDFPLATLLVRDFALDRLFAVASNGYATSSAGAEVALGEGVIGTAAASAQVVCVPNLARTKVMQSAVRTQLEAGPGTVGAEIPLPGLAAAQSIAAVPMEVRGEVVGVLYLESERAGRFGPHNQRLLRILGRHLAAALSGLGAAAEASAAATAAPGPPPSAAGGEDPIVVTYYQADDSVFVGDAYLIKGAAGRILWKMLGEHAASGRTEFTNRELRLDESLGLPAGADNLEARLLVLRKRLGSGELPIGLERVGRGRLALRAERPLRLAEVETGGVMSAAHGTPDT